MFQRGVRIATLQMNSYDKTVSSTPFEMLAYVICLPIRYNSDIRMLSNIFPDVKTYILLYLYLYFGFQLTMRMQLPNFLILIMNSSQIL